MKIGKAVDIIDSGGEKFEKISQDVTNINEDIGKALHTIKEWSSKGILGETQLDYYIDTGKTVTLSVAFREYWSFINGVDVQYSPEEQEEYFESEVDFKKIYVTFEDEGDQFEEVIQLDLREEQEVLEYLTVSIKDFVYKE